MRIRKSSSPNVASTMLCGNANCCPGSSSTSLTPSPRIVLYRYAKKHWNMLLQADIRTACRHSHSASGSRSDFSVAPSVTFGNDSYCRLCARRVAASYPGPSRCTWHLRSVNVRNKSTPMKAFSPSLSRCDCEIFCESLSAYVHEKKTQKEGLRHFRHIGRNSCNHDLRSFPAV
jgi:hypothetical protein